MEVYVEEVNKIKKNADAYSNLLGIEYYFCLGYKGKGFEVRVHFSKEEFHHLEGIGQLRDLKLHSESGNRTFDMALAGDILEDELKKSHFYQSGCVQNKVDYFYLLERIFDEDNIVFRFRKTMKGSGKIEAELFLTSELEDGQFFVYLDRVEESDEEYYCRSFVANPEFDRTQGQVKLTTLWKEKINLETGESTVLYRYKDFSPDQLNK